MARAEDVCDLHYDPRADARETYLQIVVTAKHGSAIGRHASNIYTHNRKTSLKL